MSESFIWKITPGISENNSRVISQLVRELNSSELSKSTPSPSVKSLNAQISPPLPTVLPAVLFRLLLVL